MDLPKDTNMSQILSSIYQINDRYNKLAHILKELESGEFATLAKETHVADQPYKPARMKILLMGLVAGAFIGVGTALISEWFYTARREYKAGKY